MSIPTGLILVNKECIPFRKYETDSGWDVKANIKRNLIIWPFCRKTVPIGIIIEPPGFICSEVRPRSGLSKDEGLIAVVGTIDTSYRGEIGVTLLNFSFWPKVVKPYQRIAQLVFSKRFNIEFLEKVRFKETDRGTKGFGSTG